MAATVKKKKEKMRKKIQEERNREGKGEEGEEEGERERKESGFVYSLHKIERVCFIKAEDTKKYARAF